MGARQHRGRVSVQAHPRRRPCSSRGREAPAASTHTWGQRAALLVLADILKGWLPQSGRECAMSQSGTCGGRGRAEAWRVVRAVAR
jgi:hypothetical protein